ncbi:hypothetical protein EI534_48715, partial [Pseudomonas frederiksbergensis]|nr:hypothetical protein [Pseudomonas frederiksbergensis]
RFIAGNVIEKAERIEAWIGDNPENERMPEVKQALEALKDAEPPRKGFGQREAQRHRGVQLSCRRYARQ